MMAVINHICLNASTRIVYRIEYTLVFECVRIVYARGSQANPEIEIICSQSINLLHILPLPYPLSFEER